MNPRLTLNMTHALRLLAALALVPVVAPAQQTPAQKRDTQVAPASKLRTKLPPGYSIPVVDISAERDRGPSDRR